MRDLKINQEEAKVIDMIYHMIVDCGFGSYRISNLLNAEGIHSKRGNLWRATTVRTVVRNLINTGRVKAGDVISDPVPELRIIDDYYFTKANEIMEARAPSVPTKVIPASTARGLLTGIIHCAHCDSRMTHNHNVVRRKRADGEPGEHVRDVYRCQKKLDARCKCTGQTTYEVTRVEKKVIAVMRRFFNNIKKQPTAEMLKQARATGDSASQLTLKQAEENLVKATKALEKLEHQTMLTINGEPGGLDLSIINQLMPKQRDAVEVAKTAYTRATRKAEDEAARIEKQEYELVKVKTWAETFDMATFENKRMIISSLVDKVIVGKDYRVEVVLKLTAKQFLGEEVA